MVDTDSYSQQLVSEMTSPTSQIQVKPSKFYSHFLCKAVPFVLVLVIIPLFPSQAPEFINQTIIARSWELLHLIFVGIAVSYGLFSRRRVKIEKENQSKFDTNQTYVSRILQVSSIFDDEIESPSGFDENKIHTFNSRYPRGESYVVIAQEKSVLGEQSSTSSNVSDKPLLLPVRSLRSPISDPDAGESVSKTGGSWSSLSRSSLSSKGSSSFSSDKTRNREIGDLDPLDLEEKFMDSAVLPSPIPWRSRSGRMEMNEVGVVTSPLYSVPSSVEESEFGPFDTRSFQLPTHWSSQPNSMSPSPKTLFPSPSVSPELQAKNVEDLGKKNSYMSSQTPATPLPTPIDNRSPLISSNFCPSVDRFPSEIKDVKRSFKDELKDLSRRNKEDMPRTRDQGLDYLKSEAKHRTHVEGSRKGKSVSPIDNRSPLISSNFSPSVDRFPSEIKDVKRSFKDELKDLSRSNKEDMPRARDQGLDYLKSEAKHRTHVEGSRKGKSVRTIRASEPFVEARKAENLGGVQVDEKTGKGSKEGEAVLMVKTGRTEECDPTSLLQESRAKNLEDLGKKKNSYKSSPHPAQPMSPPNNSKSPLVSSNSSPSTDGFLFQKKDVKESLKEEMRDLSRSNREAMPSGRDLGLDYLKSDVKPKTHIEGSSKGKSVRTIRGSETVGEARKAKEGGGDPMDEKTGKRSKEIKTVFWENPGRTEGFDMPMRSEKQNCESPRSTSNPIISKYQKKEKIKNSDRVILETEEYSSNGVDEIQRISEAEEAFSNTGSDAGADPNEVNKKAEEFIAKFREQIRLQRINSIKRASGQHSSRNS